MFHALIIKQSLKSLSPLKHFKVLGTKQDEDWNIYKIAIPENWVDDFAKESQKNMDDSQEWYMHIYNEDGSKLIIIFRNKIFKTDNSPQNWNDVIKFGESLGIPTEQLDFFPNSFKVEEF